MCVPTGIAAGSIAAAFALSLIGGLLALIHNVVLNVAWSKTKGVLPASKWKCHATLDLVSLVLSCGGFLYFIPIQVWWYTISPPFFWAHGALISGIINIFFAMISRFGAAKVVAEAPTSTAFTAPTSAA